MMKFYFYTRKRAEDFQKLCKDCRTRRYYVEGTWYVFIATITNFFGQIKKPIIPELEVNDLCYNTYQNIIELLKVILDKGNNIEQAKARKLILTISKMQVDGEDR